MHLLYTIEVKIIAYEKLVRKVFQNLTNMKLYVFQIPSQRARQILHCCRPNQKAIFL